MFDLSMSDIIGFNHKYYQSFVVEFRQPSDDVALLLTVFTLPPASVFVFLLGFSYTFFSTLLNHAEVMLNGSMYLRYVMPWLQCVVM